GGRATSQPAGIASSTCPTRFDKSNSGAPMITGRKIANGSAGKRVPVRKTPLMAALQATAIQSVYGIMTASQVVRRWSDAVPAGIVPPRLAWRSLLWTVPLTLLWIVLIYWQPTISTSGVANAAPRLMAYGLIGLGLWLGLESTDLTSDQRRTTWLAVMIPYTLWMAVAWSAAINGVFRTGTRLPALPLATCLPVIVDAPLLLLSKRVGQVLDAMPASC